MLVVNLLGGPGTGKSTTAAGLFAELKHRGHKVELVTEVAKDMVYERVELPFNQQYILEEQYHRQERLRGHVDIVVTDGPLIHGLVYAGDDWGLIQETCEKFEEFNNFNVFLRRVKPYQTYGRLQDEDGAINLDREINGLPITFNMTIDADRDAARHIADVIEHDLSKGHI